METLNQIKDEVISKISNNTIIKSFVCEIKETFELINMDITNMSSAKDVQNIHKKLDAVKLYLSYIQNINSTLNSFMEQVYLVKTFTYKLTSEASRKLNGFVDPGINTDDTSRLDLLYKREYRNHRSTAQELRSLYDFKHFY